MLNVLPYRIESATKRTMCHGCRSWIEEDEVRIAIMQQVCVCSMFIVFFQFACKIDRQSDAKKYNTLH